MPFQTIRWVRAALMAGGAALATTANAQEPGTPIPPISLNYYAGDMGIEHEQSARILADDWARLGLQFDLQPIQFGTFVSTINVGGQLNGMAVPTVGPDPDRLDPTYWLFDSSACGQRRNATKFCDEEYSELAELQRTQTDPAERRETVLRLQQMHYDAAAWWPVTHILSGMVWNSERWDNVTNPAPLAPHEGPTNPWLKAVPLTDDRILDWAHLEDVSSYNPLAEEGAVGWLRFVYDTFAKTDVEGNIVPWAAESWEFTDASTLRVTLREGMTFHDGEPVTADDAVFTLNTAVEIQPPAMVARIGSIERAEMVDELTFDIHLTNPDASFVPTALTFLFILPEHHWADYEGDMVDRDVVADGVAIGSGPFSFRSWRVNEVHELDTHTAHWAAPDYDGIRRLALGQPDAIRAALTDGTADIATLVLPVSAMSDLAMSEDHLEFAEIPTHGSQLVWMNHDAAPFSDPAFRRALRQATNSQRVLIEAYQGFSIAASAGPLPELLSAWYNDDLAPVTFDIDAARAILEDAGYSWDDNGRLLFPAE
ncbi:ABC transporter substrate-binding protein [Paracoccus aerodenitrificans]|uniref:ABC transporter substrate-binding protein n=1 Tax=Paracoccus aerodenitrificans TaxID=3017781 RepID=UPI0022F0C663|nr:ABC transporter substrate-binding protein [Paracoccus aerodenitrificans]WBU63544.1 ABC transporter substrate-binding protein [Paracoccus aerodenitrificans]